MYERLYCVEWRSGGTARFRWQRTLPAPESIAKIQAAGMRNMGFVCYVKRYSESVSIGLPETFAPGDQLPEIEVTYA